MAYLFVRTRCPAGADAVEPIRMMIIIPDIHLPRRQFHPLEHLIRPPFDLTPG